jgi:uncharacterized membrane protein
MHSRSCQKLNEILLKLHCPKSKIIGLHQRLGTQSTNKENAMKETILISVFCLLVTYPAYAYETDSLQSIEGTVWGHYYCSMMGCGYTDHVGFFDGSLYILIHPYRCFYTTAESRPAGYLDLPGIGLFWHKNYCLEDHPLICQRNTGVLFPSTGKGVRSCAGIPCPRSHTLEMIPNMSLPEDICPEGIMEYMMTRDPQMDTGGCRAPIPTDTFYDHDEEAYCWAFFLATLPEDEYRCMWYKPDGELYHDESFQVSYEAGCWYASIPIKGDTPATTFGEWHVDVYLNGIKAFTQYFTIAASDYEYIELLPPGCDDYIKATHINDGGLVVGSGHDGTSIKGFIYNNGAYTKLLPPGWRYASAYCINDKGEVVGEGDEGESPPKGFLYSEGEYTELLPPGWNTAYPHSINNSGEVVGEGFSGTNEEGFLYSKGQYTELLPPGWNRGGAYCINDSGVVVGYLDWPSDARGFIYNAGEYTELLPPGCIEAYAYFINNNGVVVGSGYDGTTSKGFIYSDGTYTELLPPGWDYAYATSINDSGVVIGGGNDGTIQKGFVYSNGEYTELFPPWSISTYVTAINNSGVVVGWGTDTAYVERAFIAFPK